MEKRKVGLLPFVAAGVVSLVLSSVGTAAVQLQLKLSKGKTYHERVVGVYPDKPVEPGQSWTKKMVLSPAFEMAVDCKYTLEKREAGMATIAVASSVRSNADKPVEAGGMKMRFDLSGTQDGTMQMQEATGLIRLTQARQQLKGEIKIGDSAQGSPLMAVPVVFDTTIKLEMSNQPLGSTTE